MQRASFALILIAAAALAGCVEELPRAQVGFEPPAPRSCADRPYGEADRHDAEADFGCATARNLAAMLANPDDLDDPKDAAAPRGDSALAAVGRHRVGESKRLPSGSVGGSGGSNGSAPQ